MKAFVILAALALAGCHRGEPEIIVSDARARATAPELPSSALYLTIVNRGSGGDQLIGVSVPGAASATLHSTSVERGVSRMRALPGGIAIRGGETVTLHPGGTHVMLSGLGAPLVAGERFEARLTFARSGEQRVAVRVDPAGGR